MLKQTKKEEVVMKLIEWEVNEDDYQEQIVIPEAQRELAAKVDIDFMQHYCNL